MFDTHERILQKLAESGQKEFTAAMVREAMDKVEEEDIDSMYHDWLRETDPYASHDAELTSWEEATDDLGDFPELQDKHDMEMER